MIILAAITQDGSSPRARGTLIVGSRRRAICRFIPAGAGNAQSYQRSGFPEPVHPRGRGERAGTAIDSMAPSGSSPRARGTRRPVLRVRSSSRFIPAGAGNALSPVLSWSLQAVHPRGRGERGGLSLVRLRCPGSSPRARGTHCSYFADFVRKFREEKVYQMCPHFKGARFRLLRSFLGGIRRQKTHQSQSIEIHWYSPVLADGKEIIP